MAQFRSSQEIQRAQWAEKYMSVADGRLYAAGKNSPFPIHEYFKLGLLGKEIKMLEVNAGHAVVENMVADTLTEMSIQVGDKAGSDAEKEIREWLLSIDNDAKLEESMRSFYAVGYGVQQLYRTIEDKKNEFTIATIDPSTWYPVDPGLLHLKVIQGKVICTFEEEKGESKTWYALVEDHTVGNVSYKLYQLEHADAKEGKEVPLSTLARFSSLTNTKTGLDKLPIVQIDRVKPPGYIFGTSVLYPIWGLLQEISEIQTQIRQERIKNFRSRLAVPRGSLVPVEEDRSADGETSKTRSSDRTELAKFDLTQDIFPIPTGAQAPAYIQWDMQLIEKGSNEIDKLLSRAASIVGAPKSVFNLDENAGNVKVDTERRKDRRYMRKIQQGQNRAAQLVTQMVDLWRQWSGKGGKDPVKITFASPFDLTKLEKVDLFKKMNPEATLISQSKAIKEVWPELSVEDRDVLEAEIEEEHQASMEPPPTSVLNKIPKPKL